MDGIRRKFTFTKFKGFYFIFNLPGENVFFSNPRPIISDGLFSSSTSSYWAGLIKSSSIDRFHSIFRCLYSVQFYYAKNKRVPISLAILNIYP